MSDSLLPMPPFDWQQSVWTSFCERLELDRLPHAFLLVGPRGVGATELAIAMAQRLLCLSPLKHVACGHCRGCLLLKAGTHPDLLRVEPEESGKQIKVDQVRAIATMVGQTAQQGGYKIVILSPAEAMNINAANALLKNLEEPAGDTVFILVSHELNRVMATIRSRCAKLDLPRPALDAAVDWLQAMGIEQAPALLFEAGGAPLLAKQMFDTDGLATRIDIAKALTDVAEHRLEPMVFAKQWQGGENGDAVLSTMINGVDRTLQWQQANIPIPSHYQGLCDALGHCRCELLYRLRDRLLEKKSQLLRSPNLNLALFMEELILDWSALMRRR